MPSGPVLSPPPLPRAASKSATLCTPPCVTPRCLSPPHAPLFITPRCREAEQLLRDQDPSGYDQVGLNPHLTLTPALTLTLTPALTLTLIFTLTLTLALTLTLTYPRREPARRDPVQGRYRLQGQGPRAVRGSGRP